MSETPKTGFLEVIVKMQKKVKGGGGSGRGVRVDVYIELKGGGGVWMGRREEGGGWLVAMG